MTDTQNIEDIPDFCLFKKSISCPKRWQDNCCYCGILKMYKMGIVKGEENKENPKFAKKLEKELQKMENQNLALQSKLSKISDAMRKNMNDYGWGGWTEELYNRFFK